MRAASIVHDDARAGRPALGQVHAFAHFLQRAVVDLTLDLDQVRLLDAEARVLDLVRELAVVREDDQALRLLVETSDRVDPALERIGDQVDGARPRLP